MRILLVTLLVLTQSAVLKAQQLPTYRCYTSEAMQRSEQSHPGYLEAVDRAFRNAQRQAEEGQRNDEVYVIPVVFHIVYNNPEHNLADSVILSQLDVLNEDYRRWNADAALTRDEFLPVAADAGIQFVLATEDPDGNPTSGITRTETATTSWFSLTEFVPNGIKRSADGGVDAWDTERYLNIWVGDLSLFGAPFILGFAYPPADLDNWPADSDAPDPALEGVVVHNAVLGRNNPLTTSILETNTKGRTCTHEVGHYLGLRHTWGDGGGFTGQDGCSVDDGIADTPNCADASQQQCNQSNNTCLDEPVDLPDMIENYMDYSDESCQNMFSQGQVDIMRAVLQTSRSGLVTTIPATVTDLDSRPDVKAFPNPTDGLLTLDWKSNRAAVIHLRVVDAIGRNVHTQSVSGPTPLQLDLGHLHGGVYSVHLRADAWQHAVRFVIE